MLSTLYSRFIQPIDFAIADGAQLGQNNLHPSAALGLRVERYGGEGLTYDAATR